MALQVVPQARAHLHLHLANAPHNFALGYAKNLGDGGHDLRRFSVVVVLV